MNVAFSLTNDQIEFNYNTLMEHIETMFPTRVKPLMAMYKDLEIKAATAPASGTEYFHNAFSGGYLDHVLRVLEYSFTMYETWKSLGLDVDTFTVEELAFVAIHHDLGKLGFPGDDNDRYVWNGDDFTRKKFGLVYETNPEIPYAIPQHLALYLLQRYGVKVTWNEMLAILIHDGLYEEENKSYYVSYKHKSRLRTSLPKIIHQADMMAAQFEYERWANLSKQGLSNYRE